MSLLYRTAVKINKKVLSTVVILGRLSEHFGFLLADGTVLCGKHLLNALPNFGV